MADRTYKWTLDCGCMISADAGGCCHPCTMNDHDPEQNEKCAKAWEKWQKTPDYQVYLEEVLRNDY